MSIWKTTVWSLAALLVTVGCSEYQIYLEFDKVPYDTNDSGFVQGVMLFRLMFLMAAVIVGIVIPMVASKLLRSQKFLWRRFALTSVAVSMVWAAVFLPMPILYVIGGSDLIEYLFVTAFLAFVALFLAMFCSLVWWCIGLVVGIGNAK